MEQSAGRGKKKEDKGKGKKACTHLQRLLNSFTINSEEGPKEGDTLTYLEGTRVLGYDLIQRGGGGGGKIVLLRLPSDELYHFGRSREDQKKKGKKKGKKKVEFQNKLL